MATMKVKSTNPASQGPFVVIDEKDYDPAKHEMFDEAPKKREHAPAPAAVAPAVVKKK